MELRKLIFLPLVLLTLFSCEKEHGKEDPSQTRKTFVVCALGYNNLRSDLLANIRTLVPNAPFESDANNHKLILFSHLSLNDSDYNTPTNPVLIDVYRKSGGRVVLDTLLVMDPNMSSGDARTIHTVLSYVKEKFPSKEFGLLLSSHATGWLPQGYYSKQDNIDWGWTTYLSTLRNRLDRDAMNVRQMPQTSDGIPLSSYFDRIPGPRVKSVGAKFSGTSSSLKSSDEMELESLAAAIPMHLKYMIFDACLMGGIECVYQFRNVSDYIAASPTEILSSGMEYDHMLDHLLYADEPDLVAVCDDYYRYYAKMNSSATITLVESRKLNALAERCSSLFEKYRTSIASVNASKVQRYFRMDKHWFYDLRDILVKAEISAEDLSEFDRVLDDAIKYQAATPYFLGVAMKDVCGLSMFLPQKGSNELQLFYKGLSWNIATSLVK